MFDTTPRAVPRVRTRFRTIRTKIPAPGSLGILAALRKYEPRSMTGQPPVVWHRAEGFEVSDAWGNRWLDFSSGVLVANAGHGRREIARAIQGQAGRGLLHNYCFPSEPRARLARELARISPPGLKKVFLLTTGSETIECAIKIARAYGAGVGGPRKIVIVSFERSFHGRTLGAQMVGGIPDLKSWIGRLDPYMVQVPFPDGFRTPDVRFELFEETLGKARVRPADVAAVVTETFQGGGASFAPVPYIRKLRRWCSRNRALFVLDEIQAAFGRTGRMFGFEHYGVVPDLICLGKGITSSLPLSALVGRARVMDLFGPNSMTSTHTGNPIAVASALANLAILRRDRVVQNARLVGAVLHRELERIRNRFLDVVGAVHGRGLVAGVHIVRRGTSEPDPQRAHDIVRKCIEKGLLLFAPVGYKGATVKIAPPLVITEPAVREGTRVLEEAIEESL